MQGPTKVQPALPPASGAGAVRPLRAVRPLAAASRLLAGGLRISEPDDALEREADRVAERVMGGGQVPALRAAAGGLHRMCRECEEEDTLQRKAHASHAGIGAAAARGAVSATRGPGAPLPGGLRQRFESRFGHDFSDVRVHTGATAQSAARGVHARAYTLGSDIVFDAGEYDPRGPRGQRLLAHELAHVVQQRAAPRGIQAKLRVEDPNVALPGAPPRENWQEIRGYIGAMTGDFTVASTGDITPNSASVCSAPTRVTERCLCDLHSTADDWKIKIDDIDWPHTEEANHRVTVHSTRSPITFGAWGGGASAGTRIIEGNERVLAHELCGHAVLMVRGSHPHGRIVRRGGRVMGRPSHDVTVAEENAVAAEMTPGAPERGTFTDPHHGESFARITVSGYASGETDPSTLSADMQARLVRAKDAMATSPLMRADVVGHSDHTGDAATNATVSRDRARRVRSHLRGLGVRARQFMEVQGVGNSECPAGAPDQPDCRKVEVFMFIFQGASLRNP